MNRWLGRGAAHAVTVVARCGLLLALAGCAAAAPAVRAHHTAALGQDKVVLAHGELPSGLGWRLVAFEQGHQLGLDLESPSGHSYSGQVGFAASRGYSYHWGEGLGPGNAVFYYGPVPGSAVMVRLSTPGHQPMFVRTAAFPAGRGLPAGRPVRRGLRSGWARKSAGRSQRQP